MTIEQLREAFFPNAAMKTMANKHSAAFCHHGLAMSTTRATLHNGGTGSAAGAVEGNRRKNV